MIIKTFLEPPIDNNNYLIIDEKMKEAALIDCSSYDENIYKFLDENDFKLRYILLTHGHFDHIIGIKNNPEIKVLMHEQDMEWILKANEYLPAFGIPYITIPNIDKFVKDNDTIELGNLKIKVIHTPGHTRGGVCYLVEDKLFSGDTIFKEAVGRCDLPGGDFEQIVQSINNKIFTLDNNIEIYPGHGATSTVGWEKLHNKFL